MKIGVISDTHELLRPEVARCFAGVSHIIHAGDIGALDVVDGLRWIAPVTAIRGNVDRDEWAKEFPETETLHLGGRRVYVLHDLNELKAGTVEPGIDVVISGHSHRVRIEVADGVLYLNPGSAGKRRFQLPITVATLELDRSGPLQPIIHDLDAC